MDMKRMEVDATLQERKLHGNLEYPVGVYNIDMKNVYMGFVRWHWHEEMEISLVKQGQVEVSIGDDTFILKEGESILVNQNVLHTIHPASKENCVIQVVVFHPAYLFGYGETYMCTKYLNPIVATISMKHLLLQEKNPFNNKVKKLIDCIIADNLEKKFGYELSTKRNLCDLWLLLLNNLSNNPPAIVETSALSSDKTRTKQGLMYIQENYAETITLDSLAEAIHISKSECCRCFKRSLNLTPFEYIIKYRIYMSTRLMMQRNPKSDSISELALSVGFNNTSYYNKWFKHYLKCTPSQYKRYIQSGNILQVELMAPPLDKDEKEF